MDEMAMEGKTGLSSLFPSPILACLLFSSCFFFFPIFSYSVSSFFSILLVSSLSFSSFFSLLLMSLFFCLPTWLCVSVFFPVSLTHSFSLSLPQPWLLSVVSEHCLPTLTRETSPSPLQPSWPHAPCRARCLWSEPNIPAWYLEQR